MLSISWDEQRYSTDHPLLGTGGKAGCRQRHFGSFYPTANGWAQVISRCSAFREICHRDGKPAYVKDTPLSSACRQSATLCIVVSLSLLDRSPTASGDGDVLEARARTTFSRCDDSRRRPATMTTDRCIPSPAPIGGKRDLST